jgi:rhomboid protease GluP
VSPPSPAFPPPDPSTSPPRGSAQDAPTGEGNPPPPPQVRVRLPFQPVRVTYGLLVLIGLTFAAQFGSNMLFGSDVIIGLGAKVNSSIANGELWRLFTPIFIHVNVLHLLFNAYALYILGREVETFYGALRFSLVFLIAGLSGSVMSLLLNPYPAVGASGAIFGLIGAEGVLLYRNRQLLGARGRRALQNVIFIAVLNLAIGLQGGIDNWAHLGGLIGGLALSWFIGPLWALRFDPGLPETPVLGDQHPLVGARWLAVVIAAGALAALTAIAITLQR